MKPKNWKRYWTGPGHGLQLTLGPKAGRLIFYEGGTTHRYGSIRVARFNLDWLMKTNP